MSTKLINNDETTSVSILSSSLNLESTYPVTTTQLSKTDSTSSATSEARRRNSNNADEEFVVTVEDEESQNLILPKNTRQYFNWHSMPNFLKKLGSRLSDSGSPKENIAIASLAALFVCLAVGLSVTISFSDTFNPTPIQVESGIIIAGGVLYFLFRQLGYICPPLREISYLALFFTFYDVVRAFSLASPDIAIRNANLVVEIEKMTMLFLEPWMQTIAIALPPVLHFLNYFYLVAHWSSVFIFFVWLFMADKSQKILQKIKYDKNKENESQQLNQERSIFSFYRNAFILTNVVAVTSFYLFPCAPPRMLPEYGFVDTMLKHSNLGVYKDAKKWMNPFAAMPSLHFGYAFLFAFCFSRTTRFKIIPFIYPVLMLLAIVCTGNHFILDAVFGGSIAVSAIYLMEKLYTHFETKQQQQKQYHLPTVVNN